MTRKTAIEQINVLVVEDNEDELFFIQRALSDPRYNLIAIMDGEDAYQYMQNPEISPDIVLLDNQLPRMSGLEIIEKLQNENFEYSYIFLTIDNTIDTVIKAMKAGALDFIIKSANLKNELAEKVEKVYKIHSSIVERKRAEAKLIKANVELLFQNEEKEKRAEELRIAKEHAEENEERFRLLRLNMDAGIVVYAPDNSIVQNSSRAAEILGLSTDQMMGKVAIDPAWKFVQADKSPLPFAECPVNRISASKKAIKDQITGVFQPDKNEIVWVTVNGFPVLNNAGDIIEIVIIFIDITELKRVEEDKVAAKLKFEKIQKELNEAQKLAHIGSWLYDVTTQKIEWSDETFQIWGFDPKDGTPDVETLVNRIHPDDQESFNDAVGKAASQGTPYDIEHGVRLPNSKQRTLRSICQPILGDDGKVVSLAGTNQDITDQKLFEQERAKHQRLTAIGEMSASIAHDFNNSLQEIMGNLEVVKLQNDFSESTLERLNNIGATINDIAGRVGALQRFGDTEHDDQYVDLIDFNKLIKESLNQSRPLWKDDIEKEGWRIAVATDFADIPKISCNSGELKSVVYNLIKNSIEAMPEGGDLIIKTAVKPEGIFATFTDTGIGMNEEARSKVFEPFFSTKGFKLGRGLGMSGVYSIVKKHKGDITVKSSELGKGTTFEIVFPISQQGEIKEINKSQPETKKSLRVLWVDDDTVITESVSELVGLIGHQCTIVNSGKNALEHLDQNSCDIVFTDIGMPEMNGWELADAIRNRFGNDITIALVSGWDVEAIAKDQHGIDFVLQKPFTLKELDKVFLME
jgi:PAS domain S-box-containing protein